MAIIYNGTEITNNYNISYNGTNLKKVYARNTALGTLRQVWPSPIIIGHIDVVKTGDTAEVKIIDIFKAGDFKVCSPSETKTSYYSDVYGVGINGSLTTTAQTFTIKAKKTNMLGTWNWSFGTSIWSRAFCQMIIDLNDVPEGHHQYAVERTDSEFVVNATSGSEAVVINSYFRGYSQDGYTALNSDFTIPRMIIANSNHTSQIGLLMFNGEFKLPNFYNNYISNNATFFPQKVANMTTGYSLISLDSYYNQYMSSYNYNIDSNLGVLNTINCMYSNGGYGRFEEDTVPGSGSNYSLTLVNLLKIDAEQFNKFSTPIINVMEI